MHEVQKKKKGVALQRLVEAKSTFGENNPNITVVTHHLIG